MDSLPGEDPTLPLGFNGSVNLSQLPDVSGDEIRGCLGGGGALPDVAEDTVSPTRARTMKDFENQIVELRKENFNLKLRIYFLEERMQQKFDGPNEDIYRINIELKVELESLKRDLQERDWLLVKASKALESLAQGGDAEIQRLKEEAQKNVQQVEESLTRKISLLEEELKMAHEEAKKSFAMTERERVLRLAAEQQLALITNMKARDLDLMAALEEKNQQIEQLSLSLKNKEAVIQRLEEVKSQTRCSEESLSAEKTQTVTFVREKEEELEALRTEFCNQKNELEKRIQSLQEELGGREAELSVEKRNALKRDKAIQGLTLALKAKEGENEELASEIEGLTASLAKAREAAHKAQLQKYKGAEDSQVVLMEKESLLADLRSENLTKDTENRKLQRRVKRTEQELNDLHLEREKLLKELGDAQLQKSRSDKTINDLRNQLEKMHDEMVEKGKAMERHYSVLLSEGNQKLQSQEAIIARLMDSVAQKDELLQKLNEVVKEKDTELQGWCAKFQNLLEDQEVLRKENEDLIKEKKAPSDQQPVIEMSQELEKTKESQYADMLEALRKEHDVFSALIKSLKEADGINNLQEEMNSIVLLRKQLEDDILATLHLRKVLEEQIKANRREEESISSWGDQTSYMSICLRARDYLVLEIDHLSLEELKKKIVELVSVVKELHLENEDLRRKQVDLSTSDPLGKESQASGDNSEFLESAEASRTLTEAFDDESNTLSYPGPEMVSEVIPSDGLDRRHQNLNKTVLEHESAGGQNCSESIAGGKCRAQEGDSWASLSSESDPTRHGLRQAELKIANKTLDHLSLHERDGSSNDRGNKDEKDLTQPIIQLKPDPRKLAQVHKSPQPQAESQLASTEKEGLDPKPALPLNMDVDLSEVKEVARETAASEESFARQQHEGSPAALGDRGKSLRFNEEHWQSKADTKGHQWESPSQTQKANKSDLCYAVKKSRLPVLLKPSRSVGSVSSSASSQKPDMHLQHRMFDLDEDLKGRSTEAQPLKDEFTSSGMEKGTSEQEEILAGAESLIKLDDTEADVSLSSVGSQAMGKDESTSQAEPFLKLQGSQVDASLLSIRSQGDPCSKDQDTGQESETDKPESNLPTAEGRDLTPEVPTKLDAGTATTLSLLSLNPSLPSVDAFDFEATDDLEELRQRIKDLKSELAKYQALMAHFVGPNKDTLSAVQGRGEGPLDNEVPLAADNSKCEAQAFSPGGVPQELADQIQAEALASRSPEGHHEALVEKLQELLSENEAELEKEQIANMHLLDKVCRLQRRLKGVLLEGPDSLICSPVPEDQCQKLQDSHNLYVAYRQHLTNLIRAFEELLQASDVDYYVAEDFRERLSRSARLFERLEQQCVYGESMEDDEMAQVEDRTRSLSDSELSQKSSSLEPPRLKEAVAPGENETRPVPPAKLPPELLMEHLHEIRMLRHQLEESIKTNDRLRKQLEQQVMDLTRDPGSANACIHGAEPHNSLSSEIHFLREQTRLLNVMLAKGSWDRQEENEKLCDSLGKKNVTLKHLHKAWELLKKEHEKLQTQVEKLEEEKGRLTHEVYNLRNELSRLQVELSATQHQLTEKDNLLYTLQKELKVFEKLDEAIRGQKDGSREEGWKDQNPPLDLHKLLAEIQALRVQLDVSVEASRSGADRLAEPFWRGKGKIGSSSSTVNICHLFKQGSQPYTGLNEFKFPMAGGSILELQQKYENCIAPLKADLEPPGDPSDTSSHCSLSASRSQDSSLVPRHCVWADKNGRHILGSVEDYNSLRKQIAEGRKLLSELELPRKDVALLEPGATVLPQAPLGRLSSAISAIQCNLDEAARLLKLLWRVSLPMKVVHEAAYSFQDESLRAELQKFRRKLAEQEKKLHSTVKRLHSANRQKENMEKVIINQLALTHNILKKARGNLELQPAESKTVSPSKKSVL